MNHFGQNGDFTGAALLRTIQAQAPKRPRSITLTAPNGVSKRTVFSKRYFVLHFGESHAKYDTVNREFVPLDPPVPFAEVDKRTDSALAAYTAMRKTGSSRVRVFEARWDGEQVVITDITDAISSRAQVEKNRKLAASRTF